MFQQLTPNCRTRTVLHVIQKRKKGQISKSVGTYTRNYLENPVFTRPRAKNLEHKTPWVSQNTKTPTKYFSPRQYTPTAYYYLNRPGKTCIHPLVLDTIAKIWAHSMGYTLDTRHAPMTSDEPAVKKICTLWTKCDDTLPPTSDCVCFMARPWPHLFESWQTYYQHAPAKNDVFVRGWNAFIIYILIEFAIQISHSRVFLSRISLQMSGFWATCRMSATTFLGSRTTKLLRTLYVCTIPTARKHQLEHHLLPDAICRIRTIDSCHTTCNRKRT